MSSLLIEGVVEGKKIQAIKGLRAVTGWGLKESKEAVDLACAGTACEIPETSRFQITEAMLKTLDEHCLRYTVKRTKVPLVEFVAFLRRFPEDAPVSALLAILEPTVAMLKTEDSA